MPRRSRSDPADRAYQWAPAQSGKSKDLVFLSIAERLLLLYIMFTSSTARQMMALLWTA